MELVALLRDNITLVCTCVACPPPFREKWQKQGDEAGEPWQVVIGLDRLVELKAGNLRSCKKLCLFFFCRLVVGSWVRGKTHCEWVTLITCWYSLLNLPSKLGSCILSPGSWFWLTRGASVLRSGHRTFQSPHVTIYYTMIHADKDTEPPWITWYDVAVS